MLSARDRRQGRVTARGLEPVLPRSRRKSVPDLQGGADVGRCAGDVAQVKAGQAATAKAKTGTGLIRRILGILPGEPFPDRERPVVIIAGLGGVMFLAEYLREIIESSHNLTSILELRRVGVGQLLLDR